MKKLTLLIFCMLAMITFTNAQDQESDFKASGKPFIKVFTNYHSSFTGDQVQNAFEIQRAYFGYSFDLSEKYSGKVTLDVGDPGTGKLQLTAYLKNAYFQYRHDKFTAKFGMIGLSQFGMQEKQWAGRYLYKSFQDEHKFGSSADLGVYAAYKLHSMVSIDASVLNGEGNKSLEMDSVLKYTVGLTLQPVKGLDFRAYYDRMGKDVPQQTLSFYTGYTHKKMKFGAEYNYQMNNNENAAQNQTGLSFYGSYKMKKARVFGRYDQLTSNHIITSPDPWNYAKDGQAVLAGIEFAPVKGIKITPNYQLWMPADGTDYNHTAYLSCEISF
jgi:hypothetical protein